MSSIVRLIGDVHGKMDQYAQVIKDCDRSVQVGDMGVGFPTRVPGLRSGPPVDAMQLGDHRFIRGNHDSPGDCRLYPQFIEDGTVEDRVMYIGGAFSIDYMYRMEGVSWWRDEELSYAELQVLVDKYQEVKPDVMITHECPEIISTEMCRRVGWKKFDSKSRTRDAFETMWLNHKPKLWIAGHWHLSFDADIMGTRFIILNELEWVDVNIETGEVVEFSSSFNTRKKTEF